VAARKGIRQRRLDTSGKVCLDGVATHLHMIGHTVLSSDIKNQIYHLIP